MLQNYGKIFSIKTLKYIQCDKSDVIRLLTLN